MSAGTRDPRGILDTSARSYDAMIAAIALAVDLPLYSCNPSDFAEIAGLDVVAVARARTGG